MAKKSEKKKTTKAKATEEKVAVEDTKKADEPASQKDATIVITETEDDIVFDSGSNGDPEGLKEEIKKEAARSDVLSRFLIPLFTFIAIGLLAAGLTWYYARPEVANVKKTEEKIENAPVVDEEEEAKTDAKTTETTTTAPATTQTTTPAPEYTSYTVKEGDSLSSIANANGLSSTELASYNGITDPDSLKIGQTLKIPNK